MGNEKICHFFRKPESLSIGKGIGYCDIDNSPATCEGDVKFCEKPDALSFQLLVRSKEMDKN